MGEDDDENKENNFRYFMAGRREDHLDHVIAEVSLNLEARLEEGLIVPSAIAGLIKVAKQIADESTYAVGPDFFEKSCADILAGGDGLHVDRTDES